MNLFNRMLENERVAGVKCSSDPAQDILRFKLAGGKDFIVFNGPDEQFVAGRTAGSRCRNRRYLWGYAGTVSEDG